MIFFSSLPLPASSPDETRKGRVGMEAVAEQQEDKNTRSVVVVASFLSLALNLMSLIIASSIAE